MKFLKASKVLARTSNSFSHIRKLAREVKFLAPLKITENRGGWLRSEIDDWISECVRKHQAGGKYARSNHIDFRRKILQQWASVLTSKDGTGADNVVSFTGGVA